jgi:hypothetical protein
MKFMKGRGYGPCPPVHQTRREMLRIGLEDINGAACVLLSI